MKPQLSVFNYSITNQTDESVDINVDGYIVDSPTQEMYREFWNDETSVSYKSFRDKIPTNVKVINLVVNSGGGHVGDAMAIHDYLASLEDKGVTVNREGRGIVASAATYLVMGKNSKLSENCLFMIHEVSGYAYGNVTEMENQVKAMRKFNDSIVDFYSKETGLSKTVIGNMMKAETWLTASEAKEKGFVKNIGGKANVTNSIKPEHWPFSNMAMLNTYNSFVTQQSSNMDLNKITTAIENGFNSLLEKVGLKGKEGDENVQNAVKDFTTSLVNAMKENGTPSQESIQEMVNTAITEAFKTVPENFQNAIKEGVKNTVTKEDLKAFQTELLNAVSGKIGNKTETGEGDGDDKKKGRQNGKPRNRFSGASYWD